MAIEVHMFAGYSKAKEWADRKNARARKYLTTPKWLVD